MYLDDLNIVPGRLPDLPEKVEEFLDEHCLVSLRKVAETRWHHMAHVVMDRPDIIKSWHAFLSGIPKDARRVTHELDLILLQWAINHYHGRKKRTYTGGSALGPDPKREPRFDLTHDELVDAVDFADPNETEDGKAPYSDLIEWAWEALKRIDDLEYELEHGRPPGRPKRW